MPNTYFLSHHGIKGQKWGVRRFRNADGTLTDKGRKRYGEKADAKVKAQYNKEIRDDNKSWDNRNALGKKMNDELQKTKEAKEYNELMKKRAIVIRDKNGNVVKTTLSYMRDDWSDPDKVIDQMVKDRIVENNYRKKDAEICNKYINEWAGATLRDLGYEDTSAGREYLIKLGIVNKVES